MPVPLAFLASLLGNLIPARRRLLASTILPLVASLLAFPAAALTPTATTLSASSVVVASGTAVTLTAYVQATGGGPYGGQVTLCDAAAPVCADIHQFGTSALVAGYASFKVLPGPGHHVYTAIYGGNTSYTAGTSNSVTVTVAPPRATSTSIVQSGSSGSYSLFTAVSGAEIVPPTGTVSFLDLSNANYVLGTAVLGSGSSTLALPIGTSCFLGSGSGASAIVTGDFNRDGVPDLAIADTTANTITICLAHLDGTFAALTQSLPTSATSPNSLAVGDFDNDGILDLAVGTSTNIPGYTQFISVLKGRGDGTFTFPGTTLTGAYSATAPVVGDFDGDGNLDIAFQGDYHYSSTIFIYYGNGMGAFTTSTTIPQAMYTFARSLFAADVNNDGRTDLVYTLQGDAHIYVEVGNSNQTVTAKSPQNLPGIPSGSIAAADFDADGHLDLAVAQTGSISILKGNGDGTFTSGTPVSLPGPPLTVAVADMNGDGKADLAVALNVGGNNVLVVAGNGDGTFSSTQVTGNVAYARALAVGDFNADGFTDIGIVNGDNATLVLANPGASASATVSVATPVGTGIHQVVASYPGDTNFAGSTSGVSGLTATRVSGQQFTLTARPASAVVGQPVTLSAAMSPYTVQNHTTDGESVTFSTFPGGNVIGYGTFSGGVATLTISSLPAGTNTIQALYQGDPYFSSDVSNDLTYNVAAATTTTLAVTTSGGTGVTSAAAGTAVTLTATVLSGSAPISPSLGLVAFCDASAPHCTDVHLLGTAQLTANGTASLRITPAIGGHSYKAVFLGTTAAAGSTSSSTSLSVTGLFRTQTTLAPSGSPGNYTLAANVVSLTHLPLSGTVLFTDTSKGNASLGSAPIPFSSSSFALSNAQTIPTGTQPTAVATGDFNGDGKQDFVVANYGNNSLTVQLGNGDGTFTPAAPVTNGANLLAPDAVAVGDFNGDGRQDLTVANYANGVVGIYLGNGDGTFTPTGSFAARVSAALYSIVVADFNNDGISDVAVTYANNGVLVLLGDGGGNFTAAPGPALTAGSYPSAIVAADFNNDGFQDVAVANVTDRTITVFFGTGDGQFPASRTLPNVGGSYGLVTADLDGDHNMDLIALDSGGNTVTILRGDGMGAFTALVSPVTATNPIAVAVGDLNGDGIPDLVTANNNANNTLDVFFGNGDGTFQAAVPYATGIVPQGLALADFNGDGSADPVTANYGSNNASVLLATTTQTAIVSVAGVSPTGPGASHAAQATYPGDTTHAPSASNLISLTPLPYAASPSFSPSAGTYTSAQSVTLSTSTPGATIFYTTDGSAATASSSQYVAPINVAASETINAIASATNFQTSPVSTAAYVINYPPSITSQPLSQTVSTGTSVVLSVTATSATSLRYQWFSGISATSLSAIFGATAASYTATPATTTYYQVQVNNALGISKSSAIATITVIQPPVCTLAVQPTATALAVIATSSCTDPQGQALTQTITWGDGTSSTASASGLSPHTYAAAGAYTVTLSGTDTSGLKGVATQLVSPNQSPMCTLSVQPTAISLAVVATAGCVDPQKQSLASQTITWGDLTSSTITGAGATLSHTYSTAGNYIVALSATDTAGLSGSTTQTVSPNQSPSCTLGVIEGETPLSVSNYPVSVSATCTDPQNPPQPFTLLSINWGDGNIERVNSSPTPYHHVYTYPNPIDQTGTYNVFITATDAVGLSGSSAHQAFQIVPILTPVVAGASSQVAPNTTIAPPPIPPPPTVPTQVVFVCATVSGLALNNALPSSVGISCTSPPFTLNAGAIPVNVTVTTTGTALASNGRQGAGPSVVLCGLASPFLGLTLLPLLRGRRRRHFTSFALVCLLCVSLCSCGGSFHAPPAKSTPGGTYYITLVETVYSGPVPTGFVQTSLIVPLTVH